MAGLHCPDGDRVEEAEAHGLLGLGVMARRPHGDERALGLAGEQCVDGGAGRTGAPQSCLDGPGRHGGVGVELDVAARRLGLDQPFRVGLRVHPLDLLERCLRGLSMLEKRRLALRQQRLDRDQPLRSLGMAGAHLVAVRRGMRIVEDGQGRSFGWLAGGCSSMPRRVGFPGAEIHRRMQGRSALQPR